jgi:chaperonin cofactor prefoldin
VPTWFAVLIALSGVILGATGGVGSAMLKMSTEYVAKEDFKEQVGRIEHRVEVREEKLNRSIDRLRGQMQKLETSLNKTNLLLTRLQTRMDEADRQ